MKPNLSFLQKVADGEVYPWSNYSRRRGRVDKFKGGEAITRTHAEAGFVTIEGAARWLPWLTRGSVTLTESGKAVLATKAT